MPTLTVLYFAGMRESRGCPSEELTTTAETAAALFDELTALHAFPLPRGNVVVAINDELARWDTPLHDGDVVALLPPVSGG